MSCAYFALPESAMYCGFQGESCRLDDFCRSGNLVIGVLPERLSLFSSCDSRTYCCNESCRASVISSAQPIMSGVAVAFEPDTQEAVSCPKGPNRFVTLLSAMTPSPNYCYAIRVSGLFQRLRLSSEPEHLREGGRGGICSEEMIHGTLQGFYFPQVLREVAWAGYRFHFLSDDETVMGRLIDCEIEQTDIALQHLDECRIAIPKTADFHLTDFKPQGGVL